MRTLETHKMDEIEKLASDIYRLILVKSNSWKQKDVDKLDFAEIESDYYYESILAILKGDTKNESK